MATKSGSKAGKSKAKKAKDLTPKKDVKGGVIYIERSGK